MDVEMSRLLKTFITGTPVFPYNFMYIKAKEVLIFQYPAINDILYLPLFESEWKL